MNGLYFLFPSLFAILITFMVVRAAALALMMTGMDKARARFQALSAFSGTGFTTNEAEAVINHPVRRKIVMWLMVLGNAGIVAVIITATSSFATSRGRLLPINMAIFAIGVYVVYRIATYRKFNQKWESFIRKRLATSGMFEDSGVEELLNFAAGYGLLKKTVTIDSPLIGKPLSRSGLSGDKVLVLGIERGGDWISIPESSEMLSEDDRLVVYGPRREINAFLRQPVVPK